MSEYTTEWTGRYPNLCYGEWKLYEGGKLLDVDIPFQGEPAETFGTYEQWYFDNWLEIFESYFDGLQCEEWIEEYKDWLSSFAQEEDWEKIYHAFQENDFRRGSCGGCI